jgi:hypothetical protein
MPLYRIYNHKGEAPVLLSVMILISYFFVLSPVVTTAPKKNYEDETPKKDDRE